MSGTRPFRFGLLVKEARPAAAWAELARGAERDGFDVLLVPDHTRPQFAPFPALVAAAAATSTLRVGTLVVNADLRNPLLLAQEAATVDILTGGRLELGLGAGWMRRDYTESGARWERGRVRAERFGETLAVLRAAHEGEPFSFRGRHHDVRDAVGGPVPIQRPLPLLIGAGGPAMLAAASTHAATMSLGRSMAAGPSDADAARDATEAAALAKIERLRALAGDRFGEIELHVLVTRLVLGEGAAAEAARVAAESGLTPEDVRDSPQHLLADDAAAAAVELRRRRDAYGLSYVAFREPDHAAARAVVAAAR